MIEVSLLLLTLLVEALVVCMVILIIWLLVFIKHKKNDRAAVKKLIQQIKHQSKTRLEETGSFLNEKYRFEGKELKQAIKSIDRAEKKFVQTFINVYLKRDAHGLTAMDATVAEMIDTYKSLSPVMPEADDTVSASDLEQELSELKAINTKLADELHITKETMSNMISEFGNMFGGGKDHELDQDEVVEKVKSHEAKENRALVDDDIEIESIEPSEISEHAEVDVTDLAPIDQEIGDQKIDDQLIDKGAIENKKTSPPMENIDDEVDDLLNSIDLSDTK